MNIPEVTVLKIQESHLSSAGKEKVSQNISRAKVAQFQNDCGELGLEYTHTIEGRVHPPIHQYPLNPGTPRAP